MGINQPPRFPFETRNSNEFLYARDINNWIRKKRLTRGWSGLAAPFDSTLNAFHPTNRRTCHGKRAFLPLFPSFFPLSSSFFSFFFFFSLFLLPAETRPGARQPTFLLPNLNVVRRNTSNWISVPLATGTATFLWNVDRFHGKLDWPASRVTRRRQRYC